MGTTTHEIARKAGHGSRPQRTEPSPEPDTKHDRALAPDPEERNPALKRLFTDGLEEATRGFVEHYKHRRYHESLGNLTPAHVYNCRADTTLRRRKEIKQKAIEKRRLLHRQTAA